MTKRAIAVVKTKASRQPRVDMGTLVFATWANEPPECVGRCETREQARWFAKGFARAIQLNSEDAFYYDDATIETGEIAFDGDWTKPQAEEAAEE